MKNKIIILLIILFSASSCVFADDSSKVISDSTKQQKEILDSFNGLNPYSKNFFTPHINKTVTTEEDILHNPHNHGSVPPVKKLRLMLQNKNKPKQAVVEDTTPKNQAILDCENMQYFAERSELEADGNVVLFFPSNNSTIKADKMIYNQDSNLIKAYGNVVLISDGKQLNGDFMQMDMNEENAFMDNPKTHMLQISCKAKKGYMYGDKIIQEQGSMYVTKKTMIDVKAEMFGPDLTRMFVPESQKGYLMKEGGHGEKFRIKTREIIVNSKDEHDTVTLKHAEIYFNGKKVGTIPTITLHTNKNQDYLEANYPEIGTMTNLGFFAGPGFDFDTPRGTNLKIVPMINYQGNSDNPDNNSLGFGAIAKYKSATNKTDFAYGTANKIFLMAGIQRLDDDLYLQYGANRYLDDWFLGFRMPALMGELIYTKDFLFPGFLGKTRDMVYTHRITAAYVQDAPVGSTQPLGTDGIGTLRLRYMAEAVQTLYSLGDERLNPINARLDLVGEGSAGVYGTGDTQMIARIGPRIHTQYKNWMQDVGYFLSGYSDKTPLINYDRYMYGRSNVYLQENYRLCKYLTVSWLTSLNLSQDSWNGQLMQENSFFFSFGPEEVKLNIGYDTIRQQSFVTMAVHFDAKGSKIDYDKMVIKNPDTLGKNKNGNNQQQDFSPKTDDEETGVQRAEVIDIPTEAL